MYLTKGKSIGRLRKDNISAVLKVLATKGESSRIELSKILELSKMTISNIATQLIEYDIIEETNVQMNTDISMTGPKPRLLAVKQKRILAIGIYVSRDGIYCSLSDIREGDIYSEQIPFLPEDTDKNIINKISNVIENVLEYNKEYSDYIVGIGITSVGVVDRENGVIVSTTDFFGINKLNIKKELEKRFDYNIYVYNEAQASGLAELLYGHGRNIKNFIYLEVSNGIGAAIVCDGKMMTGGGGFASEAGHMCIDRNGKKCNCGNVGCLEMYVTVPVLLKETNSNSFEEFLEKVMEKDDTALVSMENFINNIEIGLTNIVNILDTDCIILGHEGALIPKKYIEIIEAKVNSHIIQRDKKHISVISSFFYDKAPRRGSTAIVFEHVFSSEISIIKE